MYRDPLDELIDDLDRIAPPTQPTYGGGSEAFNAVQHWLGCILRRCDEAYPGHIDEDDPEVQQERENMHRALNRFVGRPEDWRPDPNAPRRPPRYPLAVDGLRERGRLMNDKGDRRVD